MMIKQLFFAISCSLVLIPGTVSAAFAEDVSAHSKLGLALGGGGARGAAHIGVLRVFEQEGIKPDIIVGNSMGSIVGSLYCAGVSLDKIEELVLDGRLRKAYVSSPIPVQILKKVGSTVLSPFTKKKQPGFYDGQALADFITDNVPADKQQIENLSPTFAAVVTNLLDGKAYRLTKGNLAQAVRASATIPPIMRAVEMDGHIYADGGIRSNMPTYPARAMGADVLVAIDVNEPLKVLEPKDLKSYTKTANRMANIVLAVADELHLRIADFIINPDVSGISLFTQKPEDFKHAIVEGEKAARLMVPQIKAKLASLSNKSVAGIVKGN